MIRHSAVTLIQGRQILAALQFSAVMKFHFWPGAALRNVEIYALSIAAVRRRAVVHLV